MLQAWREGIKYFWCLVINTCPLWHPLRLPVEKAMARHSSTPAWKIPWMEEPGRLQPMGSLRVGHDSVTSLSRIGEGNGNPLQCSCLENPRDSGAWWAAVYGVAQSRTRLSSSSSRDFLSLSVPGCEFTQSTGHPPQVYPRPPQAQFSSLSLFLFLRLLFSFSFWPHHSSCRILVL